MLVGRGALSFRTFKVGGKNSTPGHDRILERLDTFAFKGIQAAEEGSVGGWIAPDHLFDGDFNSAKVFRGRYALFALRIDTRKVSGPLLQAHTAIALQAALEGDGVEKLSGRRKREIKLAVKQQLLAETPPVQRAHGVFWNVKSRRIFLQNTSKTVVETFLDLFERTFELDLELHVPGLIAGRFAREHGLLDRLQEALPMELGPRAATATATPTPTAAPAPVAVA